MFVCIANCMPITDYDMPSNAQHLTLFAQSYFVTSKITNILEDTFYGNSYLLFH